MSARLKRVRAPAQAVQAAPALPAEEAEEQRKLAKLTVDALLNLPLPPEEPERVPVPSIELDPCVRPSLLLHKSVW